MINEERRKIQLEAFEALKENNFNGIFLLPTGSGKSWVLIEALRELIRIHNYKKVWYLCNSTPLRDTDFVKEMIEWGAEDLIPIVERMCYQKAYKLKGKEIDILIADEFDFSLTEIYSRVYFNNTFKHKILTTAYIDESKIGLSNKVADVVYSKSLQEVEDKQILNKSKYHFVNFLMKDEETKIYLRFGESIKKLMERKKSLQDVLSQIDEFHKDYKYTEKQIEYINHRLKMVTMERKRFLNSLSSSASTCRKLMQNIYDEDKNCKILTFCELTKQADSVSKYSYHGNEHKENLQKFRDNVIQSLAVCGKVNRGVNISDIKYIIFESCNQSKTQVLQKLGRGKRLLFSEMLNVYFLIPCYQENGKVKFTKVKDWIMSAGETLDFSKAETYRFKR